MGFLGIGRHVGLISLGCLISIAYGDINWPEAERRAEVENRRLAARPQGHNGEYFVVCTLYYTPRESGFTAARGFNARPETRPGLGGRKYPADFLRAVKLEGIGKVRRPVGGLHYMRYEGKGRYGFCAHPTGYKRRPLQARRSCAVKVKHGRIGQGETVRLMGRSVEQVFRSDRWRVTDTGGSLRQWQLDLYWGEDDPMSPDHIGRPAGTKFEYGYAVIRSGGRGGRLAMD